MYHLVPIPIIHILSIYYFRYEGVTDVFLLLKKNKNLSISTKSNEKFNNFFATELARKKKKKIHVEFVQLGTQTDCYCDVGDPIIKYELTW